MTATFVSVRVKVTEEQGEKATVIHVVIKSETSVQSHFYLNIDMGGHT